MSLPFAGLVAGSTAERKPRKHKKKHHKKPRHHHVTPKPAPKPVKQPVSTPTPIATPASPILSPTALHLARRFSFGVTPELGSAINGAGGARAWLVRQLDPSSVPDPLGDQVDTWFGSLRLSPADLQHNDAADQSPHSWEAMVDLSRWTVARRVHSSRQVLEVMTDFWSNLFNVPLGASNGAQFARADYDRVIRASALSSFEQLLQQVIVHPAMGINLSNNESNGSKGGVNVNENLGRELLELHTVGFGAGYTEDDVKASAKMLSGFRVTPWTWNTYGGYYPAWHYVGSLTIFGKTFPNGSSDGRAATADYLSYLARHPKTAARIARRLCVRFVSDAPSQGLVDAVTAAYTDSGTDIKKTLLAIVDHPEFAASAGRKLRSPQEDWQAMVRALGITLLKPTSADADFVNTMVWQYKELGAAPYEWSAPNGYPEVNAAWSSAGRMLNSFDVHRDVTLHWWPGENTGAITPDVRAYLPPLPATLQNVIDILGVQILGQTPGPEISQAVATLLGKRLDYVVTTRDGAKATNYWFVPSIVCTLLDSPLHLYR